MGLTKSRLTYSQNCNLGDCFDSHLDHVIPNPGYNGEVKTTDKKAVNVEISQLSYLQTVKLPFDMYTAPNIADILDFLLTDVDKYLIKLALTTETRRGPFPDHFPENADYCITGMNYGAYILCVVDKNEINKNKNLKKLVKTGVKNVDKVDISLYQSNCRMLVNFDEIQHSMTLATVCQFAANFRNGADHDRYKKPIKITGSKKIRNLAPKKIDKIQECLFFIYAFYRKFELKFDEIEVFQVPVFEDSLTTAVNMLAKVQESFTRVRNDTFMVIYPVAKVLFWTIVNYLKHALADRRHFDETMCQIITDDVYAFFKSNQKAIVDFVPVEVVPTAPEEDNCRSLENILDQLRRQFAKHLNQHTDHGDDTVMRIRLAREMVENAADIDQNELDIILTEAATFNLDEDTLHLLEEYHAKVKQG